MEHIESKSVENELFAALQCYYQKKLGGTKDEFNEWYNELSKATDGWKVMSAKVVEVINGKYGIPKWFMEAVYATI